MNFETAIQLTLDLDVTNQDDRLALDVILETGTTKVVEIATAILNGQSVLDSFSKLAVVRFAKTLEQAVKTVEEQKEIRLSREARKAQKEEQHKETFIKVYEAVAGTPFQELVNQGAAKAVDRQFKNILFAIELETGLSIEKLLKACENKLEVRDGKIVCVACGYECDDCTCEEDKELDLMNGVNFSQMVADLEAEKVEEPKTTVKIVAGVKALRSQYKEQEENQETVNGLPKLTEAEKELILDYLSKHGFLTGVFFRKNFGSSMYVDPLAKELELTEFAQSVFKFVNQVKAEENKKELDLIEHRSNLAMAEVKHQIKISNQSVKKDKNVKRAQAIGKIKYHLTNGHLIVSLDSSTLGNETKFIRQYMKSLGVNFLGRTVCTGTIIYSEEATQEIIKTLFSKAPSDFSYSITNTLLCCASIGLAKDGSGLTQASIVSGSVPIKPHSEQMNDQKVFI